ncbi:MAG TPA: hypothetical protein VLH08_10550 [Acidobacteriota bacterium]|nr:hypothetical protein [Acidobacteriota bacterium]
MIRINKYSSIQPVNEQTTEQAQPASKPQAEESKNISTHTASSANTWQRASVLQDGLRQQISLQPKHGEQDYQNKLDAIKQNKAAAEERQNGSLLGTIFLGPIIGTVIGEVPNAKLDESKAKRDELQNKMEQLNDDIERMEKEAADVKDNSAWGTFADWLSGSDGGGAEMNQTVDPLKNISEAFKPKLDPDDD